MTMKVVSKAACDPENCSKSIPVHAPHVYLMYSYVSLFTKNTISSAFLYVWSHAATHFIYLFLEIRLLSAVLPIPILWVLMS